jgi:opacity protein-like surface antigen
VGRATVRADQVVFNGLDLQGPSLFSETNTGWKVFAGVRPISLIGAEIEYVDFGSATASNTVTGFGFRYSINMSAKAEAAYGVVYAPIPVPFLDLYGKAGVARLQTSSNGIGGLGCFPPMLCPLASGNFQRDRTDTRFSYGAGVQFKVGRFGVRGEYERISASTGDPDLLSFGVLWSF